MKALLFIPVLAVLAVLAFSSCRTVPPLDPMTLEPSERCTPPPQTGCRGVVLDSGK